jgi:hypothetical protein
MAIVVPLWCMYVALDLLSQLGSDLYKFALPHLHGCEIASKKQFASFSCASKDHHSSLIRSRLAALKRPVMRMERRGVKFSESDGTPGTWTRDIRLLFHSVQWPPSKCFIYSAGCTAWHTPLVVLFLWVFSMKNSLLYFPRIK